METQPSTPISKNPNKDGKPQFSRVVNLFSTIIAVLFIVVIILTVSLNSKTRKVDRQERKIEHLTNAKGHMPYLLEEKDVKLMTIEASKKEFESYIDSINNLLILLSIIITVVVIILGVVVPLIIDEHQREANKKQIDEEVNEGIEIIKSQSVEEKKEIENLLDKLRIEINKKIDEQTNKSKADLSCVVSSEKTSLKTSSDRIERLMQEQRKLIDGSLMDINKRLDNIAEIIRIEKLDSETDRICEYKRLEDDGGATSDTYFSFASYYYKREDFDKVIDYCTKAVANRDNHEAVYPIWADALEAKGQLLKAWEKREKAIMLCTNTQESNTLIKQQDELMNRILSLETPDLKEKLQIEVDGIYFNMILVHKGIFTMGATAEQGTEDPWANESPAHEVFMSDYYIGETVVTQSLWNAVMGETNSSSRIDNEKEDLPKYNISLDECIGFVKKLNIKTKYSFKLPTEAQWEYAARGGSKSKNYKFSGSNAIDDVGWYWKNSGDSFLDDPYEINKTEENHCRLHSVINNRKKCNELGLYGMSGNVWEWCRDKYRYYNTDPQANPLCKDGQECVIRGGGYLSYAKNCRVSSRYYCSPNDRDIDLGFRLVIEIEETGSLKE